MTHSVSGTDICACDPSACMTLQSLVHLLKQRGQLTESEVRHFMRQLAEGVQYTHGQGVVHRDLKLGNMLLAEDLRLKIADFGLATRLTSEVTKK